MFENKMQIPTIMDVHQDQGVSNITPDDYNRMMEERQRAIEQSGQVVQQDKRAVRQPQGQNPFSAEQYSHVAVPDVPVNYGGSMADQLLNDNEVPEGIRDKYWFVFHKDNTLTFLDEDRKRSKLLNFDIVKIDTLHTMAYYDYDFDKELEFSILRNVFETKLDRALGIKGSNMKNERTVLQSQFSEQRQISEQGGDSQIREGFFKRLLGRR